MGVTRGCLYHLQLTYTVIDSVKLMLVYLYLHVNLILSASTQMLMVSAMSFVAPVKLQLAFPLLCCC